MKDILGKGKCKVWPKFKSQTFTTSTYLLRCAYVNSIIMLLLYVAAIDIDALWCTNVSRRTWHQVNGVTLVFLQKQHHLYGTAASPINVT